MAAGNESNPWPDIERIGLLEPVPLAQRPIGQLLAENTWAALTAAIERIRRAGLVFVSAAAEEEAARPLTTAEVMAFLEGEKSFFSRPLEVTSRNHRHARLRSLADVQGLDLQFGLGLEAAADRYEAGEAFLSLLERGWTLHDAEQASFARLDGTGFNGVGWGALGRGQWALAQSPQIPQKSFMLHSDEELMALDYFLGSLAHYPIEGGAFAAAARALETKGYVFSAVVHASIEDGAWRAWRDFRGTSFLVGVPEGGNVLVTAEDLGELRDVETRVLETDYAWSLYGQPALSGRDMLDYRNEFNLAVRNRLSGFDLPIRAALLGGLVGSLPPGIGHDVMEQATRDAHALLESCESPVHAMQAAVAWSKTVSTFRTPIADETRELYLARVATAFTPPEQDDVWLDRHLRLLSTTGSHVLADKAAGLTRQRVGDESLEERLCWLRELGAREAEGCHGRAVTDYEAILTHRLPSEPLEEAARYFCEILDLLASRGQADRALEVFVRLHDDAWAGLFGGRTIEAIIYRFRTRLVLCGSVDAAMESLLRG